jgi:hypothetical protein
MIEVALLLVALLALWLFVRIVQRRIESCKPVPLSETALKRGFIPGLASGWMPYPGVTAICALTAIGGVLAPEAPPFTGRWSGTRALLYELFGPYGWSALFALAAAAFATQAVAKYEEGGVQRREQKAP